ncbi:hypothetical protein L3Q82_018237 [Scortum barcoo]|uniref:Uncharacterized protein n=1 Tax=Scortum barcoo TaxID=214431 RepID=A0ACB8VJ23_9TELE|nr:hypothetical protein L3Q82_018237 [Scortum barcoo]
MFVQETLCQVSKRERDSQKGVMKAMSLISDLHLKFAEKTWNETFQLVRRCMDKSRDESKPCEPLVRSLERLQEVFNVSSMNTMKSRLEMIAKQQRMGFHITDSTCYLTADLFYLEVVLLPCGGAEEVKVAPHSPEAPPLSRNFADFSLKLAGLYTQYNIPGDNDIKLKLFASLQSLGKDLQQISHLPRAQKDSDPQVDLINNGRIGCLIAGKEDCPLTIQFYVTPTDGERTLDLRKLGTLLILHPAANASGVDVVKSVSRCSYPAFLPLSEAPHETLPACFLLKLQPAVPMMSSFVNRLSQITGRTDHHVFFVYVTIPDVDLQWAPLPKLLRRRSPSTNIPGETLDEQDTVCTVPLPGGVMHTYVLPGAAWEAPAQRGTVVDGVPFTHPAHVPALLELLRHQCAINTLLSSCFTSRRARAGPVCDLHFEVLPESETSFSVTFRRPDTDSLAVLLVKVSDAHQITCTLFGAGIGDPSTDEYLSTVMKRCMSIPETLTALYTTLEETTSAPLSPPATAEAENDQSAPSSGTAVTDTNSALTTLSQSASVPADGFAVSGSACYAASVAKSELHPEINTSPAVNPYPFTPPVGVFSHWMTNSGQLPELI